MQLDKTAAFIHLENWEFFEFIER